MNDGITARICTTQKAADEQTLQLANETIGISASKWLHVAPPLRVDTQPATESSTTEAMISHEPVIIATNCGGGQLVKQFDKQNGLIIAIEWLAMLQYVAIAC